MLIALNALTFLAFIVVLLVFKFAYQTHFDSFHNMTILIFLLFLACQSTLAGLGYEIIQKYDDKWMQVFESVQTSLFFMFVISMFYRMRSLIDGDNYFIKQMVSQARTRTFHELLKFLLFYSILTAGVTALEASNQQYQG